MFIEPSGGGSAPKEEVALKFGDSGNASIYTLAGPSGQGHETVFPDIVAEVLGMDPEKIILRASDPDGPVLAGNGTISSRSMVSHGGAMVFAAREVIRKGMDLAAKELEVAPQDLEFADGRYRVKGTDLSITIEELAKRYAGVAPHPLDSLGEIPAPRAYPGGAHVAEVESRSGHRRDRHPALHRGRRLRARAQPHAARRAAPRRHHPGHRAGGGRALHVRPASGQLLTGSFMDYYMPRIGLLRDVRLYDHSVPSPSNPLGVKGAGEAGTTGAVPTLANAVLDALRPLGINHLDFPYTPARVWEAIQAAKRKN